METEITDSRRVCAIYLGVEFTWHVIRRALKLGQELRADCEQITPTELGYLTTITERGSHNLYPYGKKKTLRVCVRAMNESEVRSSDMIHGFAFYPHLGFVSKFLVVVEDGGDRFHTGILGGRFNNSSVFFIPVKYSADERRNERDIRFRASTAEGTHRKS